jgi:membrane fusion protein (multidrug efflux system)
MAKRMIIMLSFMAAIVASLAFVKFRQFQAGAAQAAAFQPPPEAVTSILAREEAWPSTLGAIGTVTADKGVTVSADLPGVVVGITFESGRVVRAGDPLVELDTRQEQAQLAAAEAQRELSRLNLERARDLSAQGVLAQADLDKLAAEHATAVARAGEISATISRKRVRAPFTGVLGIRQVNLGQYLNAGEPVVTLQSLDPIHVDFALPQQEVATLKVGSAVQIEAEGTGHFTGKVAAVDAVVDEATRNVSFRSTLPNPGGQLKPGMFVSVQVPVGKDRTLLSLPASSVHYAPYGDSVFVIEPGEKSPRGVRQQYVKRAGARGDQVAVATGLKPGEEVVTSGVFKLRNGSMVRVDNTTQPGNDPAPKPQDT